MRNKYMLVGVVGMVVGVLLSSAVFVLAGNVDSPAAPGATNSFTLEDIYNRLDSGADGAQSTFTEPGVAPGTGTMHTLNETMAKAPTRDDANGAATGDVASGKTFWGLTTGEWGLQTGTAAGTACTGDATAGDVLAGKTFSNASATGLTGTMPNNLAVTITPTTTNQTIALGYHNGSGKVEGDADLVADKIKSGVNIFGVGGTLAPGGDATAADLFNGKTAHLASDWTLDTGTLDLACNDPAFDGTGNQVGDAYDGGGNGTNRWCMTDSGDAAAADIANGKKAWVDGSEVTGTADCSGGGAGVPKTGQTTKYADGDDGDLQKGVAWPNPRFTDNSDGTVTDNLTGLIWLKNANCWGTRSWASALTNANGLANGQCGLTDDSSAGDWRLPNLRELHSLLHCGVADPALPDTAGTGQWTEGNPFSGVQSETYWSSTTSASSPGGAWRVYLKRGNSGTASKDDSYYVWPVQGGE
jgi:hypothetical protein